jgi:hypothetical protein
MMLLRIAADVAARCCCGANVCCGCCCEVMLQMLLRYCCECCCECCCEDVAANVAANICCECCYTLLLCWSERNAILNLTRGLINPIAMGCLERIIPGLTFLFSLLLDVWLATSHSAFHVEDGGTRDCYLIILTYCKLPSFFAVHCTSNPIQTLLSAISSVDPFGLCGARGCLAGISLNCSTHPCKTVNKGPIIWKSNPVGPGH